MLLQDKPIACCIVGHRPQKLPHGGDELHPLIVELKIQLSYEIRGLIDMGITKFYTGLSDGIDIWAATEIARLKVENPEKQIYLETLYTNSENSAIWNVSSNNLSKARPSNGVTFIDTLYPGPRGYVRYLVGHTTHMLAVYSGTNGGTANALACAKEQGLNIIVINPNRLKPPQSMT